MTNHSHRSEVLEQGYTIVRGAISREEVTRLRKSLLKYFKAGDYHYTDGGKVRPDAFSTDGLKDIWWVVSKESIINVIKEIIGEDVRYCHQSDAHINLISGWHKDTGGYHALDVWSKLNDGATYGVYRVGIYLQDHNDKTPGDYSLRVRKASHLLRELEQGEPISIYVKAGDAVIFDCRMTHMGQQDVLRRTRLGRLTREYLLPYARSPKEQFQLRRFFRRVTGVQDRLAIFFNFAKCNAFTEEHITGNVRRQNFENHVTSSSIKPEVATYLTELGIRY